MVNGSKCWPAHGKPFMKGAWLSHVNHLNFDGHQPYEFSCRSSQVLST